MQKLIIHKMTTTGYKKDYHSAILLNTVRKCAPVSRTKLCEMTGIRMASITELVRHLIEQKILFEAGTHGIERGRKHVLLKLNSSFAAAIGVEFDAQRAIGLAINLEETIIGRVEINYPASPDRSTIITGITSVIHQLKEKFDLEDETILGIGIADPGLIDTRKGISVFSSTINDWREVPLRNILESELGDKVTLEESTRAKTISEKRFGAGRDTDNLMYIEYGIGIGCGLVLDGKIYRGGNETAGEIGHVRVMENGPVCACGSFGCLETVASLPAIAGKARKSISEGANSMILELADGVMETISADHVFEAARRNDKLALSIIDETAKYLGVGISSAINLFNPNRIVFDSTFGKVQDILLEPVKNAIHRNALQKSTMNLEYFVSELGDESGALGAATMVLDRFFDIPQLSIPECLCA
jgi:glucokinase-like ROK family protein